MDPSRTTTIALAERRLAWLESRQRVLAENIANADTPGYRPKDIGSFAQALANDAGLVRTAPTHLHGLGTAARPRADRRTAETAPNGNAVSLDREAIRIAETDTAHALASGLYRHWLGMFRTALGRQQ